MRKLSVLVTLLALLAVSPSAQAGSDGGRDAHGVWIVELRPGARPAEVATPMAEAHGGRAEHVYEVALQGFSFRGSAEAADALRRNPNVTRVAAATRVRPVGDGVPVGIMRIGGWATLTGDGVPRQRGTTLTEPYVPVRVAVLDSGVDSDHPELTPFVDTKSCAPGSPSIEDVWSHGTHVAGTIAARVNGSGITGLAPEVEVMPVKVIEDATGEGTDADVICGIEHAMTRRASGQPVVINMSIGDSGTVGETCAATPLRQAVCNAVGSGITVVAAAGNSAADIGTNPFVPAAYPEVIAVSAYVDGDGAPGGNAGCHFSFEVFDKVCDDTFASFSNRGAPVDVTAPGVEVYSTVVDGLDTMSGTSMASPHTAAAAALVVAANPTLTPAQVRDVLRAGGECPDGTQSSQGSCDGHGQWKNDTDGTAEPLVRADWATTLASATAGPDTTPPAVSITSPADGAAVRGTVTVSATATDNAGMAAVDFFAGGVAIGSDTSSPYSVSWTPATDGSWTLTAAARDAAGNTATSVAVAVTVDDTAPAVTLKEPLDGAAVSGTVALAADATDTGTAVTRVDFAVDGTVVASDSTSPYEASWNTTTAANGSHSLSATAYDGAGNSTAHTVAVTVENATITPVIGITEMTGWGELAYPWWYAWADVTVKDQSGSPVSGATVHFDVTGGAKTTRSCVTNAAGWCSTEGSKVKLQWKKTKVTFTAVNVTKDGATWDGRKLTVTLNRP